MYKTKQVALWEHVYERLKKRKTHERQALSEVVETALDELETKKCNTNLKDLTEEITNLNYNLPDAINYALHFVKEDRSVSFKFSDIRVTIESED